MKYLIQQKQIRGLEERLEAIEDLDFLSTTGGYVSGKIDLYGNLEASRVEFSDVISSSGERINLGTFQTSGKLVVEASAGETAQIVLNSNKDGLSADSYPAFAILDDSEKETTQERFGLLNEGEKLVLLNSFNDYPMSGYLNGDMIVKSSGALRADVGGETVLRVSRNGFEASQPIYTSGESEIRGIYLYLDRTSGLLDQVDLDKYLGASYSIFAQADSLNGENSFFAKYAAYFSANSGCFGNFIEDIGGVSQKLSFVPVEESGEMSVYAVNNCFENWRISALVEKIESNENQISSSASSESSESSSSSSTSSSSDSSASSSSVSSSSTSSSSSISSESSDSSSGSSESSDSSSSKSSDSSSSSGSSSGSSESSASSVSSVSSDSSASSDSSDSSSSSSASGDGGGGEPSASLPSNPSEPSTPPEGDYPEDAWACEFKLILEGCSTIVTGGGATIDMNGTYEFSEFYYFSYGTYFFILESEIPATITEAPNWVHGILWNPSLKRWEVRWLGSWWGDLNVSANVLAYIAKDSPDIPPAIPTDLATYPAWPGGFSIGTIARIYNSSLCEYPSGQGPSEEPSAGPSAGPSVEPPVNPDDPNVCDRTNNNSAWWQSPTIIGQLFANAGHDTLVYYVYSSNLMDNYPGGPYYDAEYAFVLEYQPITYPDGRVGWWGLYHNEPNGGAHTHVGAYEWGGCGVVGWETIWEDLP